MGIVAGQRVITGCTTTAVEPAVVGSFPPIADIEFDARFPTMTQPVQPCSDDGAGMAFTGTEEALEAMMAYAEATGAPLLWRQHPRLPFVPFGARCAR